MWILRDTPNDKADRYPEMPPTVNCLLGVSWPGSSQDITTLLNITMQRGKMVLTEIYFSTVFEDMTLRLNSGIFQISPISPSFRLKFQKIHLALGTFPKWISVTGLIQLEMEIQYKPSQNSFFCLKLRLKMFFQASGTYRRTSGTQ